MEPYFIAENNLMAKKKPRSQRTPGQILDAALKAANREYQKLSRERQKITSRLAEIDQRLNQISKERDRKVAEALKQHGIDVTSATPEGDAVPTASRVGRRKRMTRQETEELSGRIYAKLPSASTSDANCETVSSLADKTGIEPQTVTVMLQKLRRDGYAESNGRRGLAGGWRKAS